jgi:hypothetical protein
MTKLTKKSSHKRIIATWLEALKSGEYKQTKGALHTKKGKKEGFCCLGVLCDLAVKAKVIPEPVATMLSTGVQEFEYESCSGTLPIPVMKWAGVHRNMGEYGLNDSLADLNDNGKKFTTIAKIIESRPEGLFRE